MLKTVYNVNAYIFKNDINNEYCSNTFEWCNDGIESIDKLQNISYICDYLIDLKSNLMKMYFYCKDIGGTSLQTNNIIKKHIKITFMYY